MIRTFEFDDFPKDADRLMEFLDLLRIVCPDFKATLFGIPAHMRRKHHKMIADRSEWVRLGVHGFDHTRGECRDPELWKHRLRFLDRITKDPRWSLVFKAPWYGYSDDFIRELRDRGYVVCCKRMVAFPMPVVKDLATVPIWNISDAVVDGNNYDHFAFHPVYRRSGRATRRKAKRTEINDHRQLCYLTRVVTYPSGWGFVEDMPRPALLKLNLGCGPQAETMPGWTGLDHRASNWPGAVQWTFDDMIPFCDLTADAVLISHALEYLPADRYEELFLDVWRVLRPGGVLRIADADTSRRVWKNIGTKHITGKVVSHPTPGVVKTALDAVGFLVVDSEPGVTVCPHKDILLGDNRDRRWKLGHKFIVEAVKDWNIDPFKPRNNDERAMRRGRYRMPKVDQASRTSRTLDYLCR